MNKTQPSNTYQLYDNICTQLDTHLNTIQYIINTPHITLQRLYILWRINLTIISDIDKQIYKSLLSKHTLNDIEKPVLNYLIYKHTINSLLYTLIESQITRLKYKLSTSIDIHSLTSYQYEEYKKIYNSECDIMYNIIKS